MKKLLSICMAGVFLLAAGFAYGATVSDKMTFKKAVTFDSTVTVGGADIVTTTNTKTMTNKTITAPTITTPTVTSPKMAYGYTAYAYTSGSGAAYSVTDSVASPMVYKITGGSGTTTFVMTYTGTAASNAGKMYYVINSSSNTITFKQSGATGVSVVTQKMITVVGNGTDFLRLTADQ